MELQSSISEIGIGFLTLVVAALLSRIVYMQTLHPLAKFPGPWYATSFSIVGAIISAKNKEHEFFMYLVKRYGSDRPIRIAPTMLMFPRPSALKDIYRDPLCNYKAGLYDSGALGPEHIFTTLDGDRHRSLRKALSNAPWTIGQLKNTWESRFDDQVRFFIEKMREHAAVQRTVCLSDKVAEFAADIMSMISFGTPFGSVENQRDEKNILGNWRKGLTFFGFVGRCRFFREWIMRIPKIGSWFLPSTSNGSGMGWLMCEADRQVSAREKQIEENSFTASPDLLQHCLEARYADGTALTPVQSRAHMTLLIQAGADTTGTALGSILRFLLAEPAIFKRAHAEVESADKAGLLSRPIQFEETRNHLPFFVACIKEGLRLHPPATNLFARVVPKGGKPIDGHYIPGGTEVTTYAYVVQRDTAFYGHDAEEFKPERWMVSEKRGFEMDAAQFSFGMGPRVCLGKQIAMMELFKLLPEIVRQFDIEMVRSGQYVVDGGVAYNQNFLGKLKSKD